MKKKHSGPQIVAKLRQADILIDQGKTIPEVCKAIDVTDATYYRWWQKILRVPSRSNCPPAAPIYPATQMIFCLAL